jgi:hypothetical protein
MSTRFADWIVRPIFLKEFDSGLQVILIGSRILASRERVRRHWMADLVSSDLTPGPTNVPVQAPGRRALQVDEAFSEVH